MEPPESSLAAELRARNEQVELLHRQVKALQRDLAVKEELLESIIDVDGSPGRSATLGDMRYPDYVGVAHLAGYRMVDRIMFAVRRLPGFLRVRRVAVYLVRRNREAGQVSRPR